MTVPGCHDQSVVAFNAFVVRNSAVAAYTCIHEPGFRVTQQARLVGFFLCQVGKQPLEPTTLIGRFHRERLPGRLHFLGEAQLSTLHTSRSGLWICLRKEKWLTVNLNEHS